MKFCIKCNQELGAHIYGLHEQCFSDWFLISMHQKFKNINPQKNSISSSYSKIQQKKDTFFHGRYKKFSATLNEVDYILKVQETKYPDLPYMEYTCNRIATLLSLAVAPYKFIEFQERPTFVTRNFMQDYTGTLNHIYKFLPKGEKHHNCKQIAKVIMTETKNLNEVIKFVKMCLFDAFIGNNDRHGRNIGLIASSKKTLLSPMYDNPSYFGTEEENVLGADLNLSGSVWTSKSKEPRIKDYVEEFIQMGFTKICLEFKKKVLTQFPKIKKEVEQSYISEKRKTHFLLFLQKKIKEFENVK